MIIYYRSTNNQLVHLIVDDIEKNFSDAKSYILSATTKDGVNL